MDANCPCVHEEQIQNHSRKIAELEAKAEFKDQRIDDINRNIEDMNNKIDTLTKTVNEFVIKSINDDIALKETIYALTQRVTALESGKDTQWKMVTILLSTITVLMIFVNFYMNYLK